MEEKNDDKITKDEEYKSEYETEDKETEAEIVEKLEAEEKEKEALFAEIIDKLETDEKKAEKAEKTGKKKMASKSEKRTKVKEYIQYNNMEIRWLYFNLRVL